MSRPLRVVHCPALVGGHAAALAAGERELGLDSRVVALDAPPYGYRADDVVFTPGRSRLGRELERWRFVLHLLRDADVVHFNFGSPVTPRYAPSVARRLPAPARLAYELYARALEGKELGLLRRRGRAVVVTYQGDDVRTRALLERRLPGEHWLDDYYDDGDDARKLELARRFDRHANAIFALNPDLLAALPARAQFLPYAYRQHNEPPPQPTSGPIVVVHAPTDRRVKGTEYLVRAVEELRTRGIEIELRLLEGLPHDEVRARLAAADIAVDQLLSGWYGAFAVEAMAAGKPVVAQLADDDLRRVPGAMQDELPIVRAEPATIASVLGELAVGRAFDDLGERGRRFVERWHAAPVVAERTAAAYEQALSRATRRATAP
jgi:glycosyltransferase involved in cell wall biosynthesis